MSLDSVSILIEAEDYFNSLKNKFESDEKLRKKLNRLNTVFALGLIPASIALAFTETSFSITLAVAAILSIILLIVLLTYIGEKYKALLLPDDFVNDYYLYRSYIELDSFMKSNNPKELNSTLKNFRKFCYPSEESNENEKEKLYKNITELSRTTLWFRVQTETGEILEVLQNIFSKIEFNLEHRKNLADVHSMLSYLLIFYYMDLNKLQESSQYRFVISKIIELNKAIGTEKPEGINKRNKDSGPIKNFFRNSLGSGSLQKRMFSWFVFSILLTLVVKLIFVIMNEEISMNDLVFNVFVLAFTDGLAVSYLAPVVFRKKGD